MANTFIFDDDEQPDTGGNMLPDPDDEQAPEEGEGGNRTFFIILGVIGGVLFLVVACALSIFLFRNMNGGQAASIAATDTFATQLVSSTQTQQAAANRASPTLAATLALTATPTTTPVVAIFVTETPNAELSTIDPAMATSAVQQTQLAETQQVQQQSLTTTATFRPKGTPGKPGTNGSGGATSTPKIPQTGFADEVGLPALAILAVVLLGIMLLARRLRAVPGR